MLYCFELQAIYTLLINNHFLLGVINNKYIYIFFQILFLRLNIAISGYNKIK